MAAELRLRFLPAALTELIEASTHYEREREGLGARFLEAFDRALATIAAAPDRWPPAPGVFQRRGVRRYLLRSFPFAVIYRIVGGEALEVVAVAHQRRRPGYWTTR